MSTSVVGTAPTVRGWKGEDIRMRCDIQGEPFGVYWIKESISDQQTRTPKATFFDGVFESREERFHIDQDFSLVITDLEVADEGRYYCQVVHKNLEVFENSTFVTIWSMASKHTIEECVDTSQAHQSQCIYHTPFDTNSFNLTCVVSGFKPNISMLWTGQSGNILNSMISKQNVLSEDTYERFETITVSANHGGTVQTFTCTATGDSVNGTSTADIIIIPVQVVGTIPTIRGWKGKDIRLPCDIQEEPFVVYWIKKGISDEQQQGKTKAKFVDGNFKSEEERFNIERNFSLVITDLKVADEGLYHCQVVMKNLEDFDNSTYMTISSVALKHTIEQCVYGSQSHQSQCIYQTTFETPSVNITCVVSGFRPNISMQWTDGTGKTLHSVASKQTTLPDDTFERFETITVSAKHGTEQTFMCTAAGDSLFGTSTVEITILHLPGRRDNTGLVIGLVIAVPVTMVTLFLLVGMFLQHYHPDYLPRKDVVGFPAGRDHTD
ncbi:T-lymphocyte surface antigen Ly-9-like [Diadema setosum]|uniref:T-lymphocyte surface antigen Ly-9-like n=1 Tax=Diadema setosum TaxID=31175 RepID=UPI003B3B7447